MGWDRILYCRHLSSHYVIRYISILGLKCTINSQFDFVVVQDVNDDFRTFLQVLQHIDADVDFIMSNTAGNDERLAFVCRTGKARPDKL